MFLIKYYVSSPFFCCPVNVCERNSPPPKHPHPHKHVNTTPLPPQKKTATTKQKQKTKNKKTDPSFTLMTESLSNMTGEALCKGLR